MRKPPFGESNMGALAGAVVGAIGGLFAVGIGPAILGKDAALLFATPILGTISLVVSGSLGWVIGGQVGPRLGEKFEHPRAELAGGALAGMVPVILIALWALYMVLPD